MVVLVMAAMVSAACGGPPRAGPKTAMTAASSSGCARATSGSGTGRQHNEILDHHGVDGSYLLTVPRSYRPGHPAPLILLFYGFASTPAQFTALTGLPAGGAAQGDLVAVPHIQPGESEWQFSGKGTDAAFVDAVVRSLETTYCVDTHAVVAAGFSAGAAFTIAYACTHQRQIAAIATVAVEFQLGCTRPLPILAFHGTADPLVPYQNGAIGLSLPGIKVRGTELNMGDWARLDRCHPAPIRTVIGTQVERQTWRHCAPGTAVVLYTILGGGHTWPGADPARGVGLTTGQVDATTTMLRFFHGLTR
jgi:polyhydroxybutyrate depolymerase